MTVSGPKYTASEEMIYSRGEFLQWCVLMEWDWSVIDQIMYHDNPTPDAVRRLVYRHGPDKALQLLKVMQE
jgi:hypothetical protein